ncbi:GTPase [Streptomyces sp. NPDC047082]|uniref:GTPase n=1 Tax=Streptomyces sp. NPDC047082 TaxID=3155259 RepID=UPI0033C46102
MADGNPAGVMESDGDLNARLLALSARAERVLSAHARTRGLVANLPHADVSPLRIALLGPYSAGKSMLIAALLRLPSAAVDELVDAAPKTHEPTPYPWNGVILVDLPGTLSGNDEHSGTARLGVRGADALMIVTTSELPGEAETKAILQALDTEGFADRSVVVVNKMNAENSDRDVILDEIRKRLGPFADRVPIVPTDARDYVDAINDPDLTVAQRDLLFAESGVDALADELQRMVAPGVSDVRPKAQAFELLRVLADAEQHWVLEGEELRAAETAKKVEESISQTKRGVLSTLERERDVVASVIRAAGSKSADGVSEKDGTVPTDVARDVSRELARAMAEFDTKFSSSMRTAFDALVGAYGTDVPEPGVWVNDLDSPEATIDASPDDESRFDRAVREGAVKGAKEGVRRAQVWIGKVAASDSGQGSVASDIATWINKSRVGQKMLNVGKKVSDETGKFKPWGRGKAAEKVANTAGKAQWALAVIGPMIDLQSVAHDWNERKKLGEYRKTIKRHFDEEALRTRSALDDSGTRHLDEWIVEVAQSLSGLTDQGPEISAERETALRGIKSLRDEAEKLVRLAD